MRKKSEILIHQIIQSSSIGSKKGDKNKMKTKGSHS